MFTKEQIKNNITTIPKWTERAILALYRCQTSEEQVTQETREENSVGFNGVDAKFLSSLAQQLLNGYSLSPKQLTYAQKAIGKYAGQLYRIQTTKERD